jgi:kumamolisin
MPTIPTPLTEEIMISVYLKRDTHDNGMTLQQYADGIMAGTQPILDHDAFVYQFGAPDDALNLVVDWANANNLTIVEAHHGTATVKTSGTADQFNKLFNVVLQTVTDTDRTYITHDGTITVPTEIDDVVELVLGLDNSGFLTHNAIIESDSTGLIDPNLVSSPTPVDHALAYKFPRTHGSNQKQGLGACIGILELGGGYTAQNLSSTFGRIGLTAPTVVDYSVDGSANNYYLYDPSGANAEVVLDIYCAGAVAPGAKQVIYFAPNTFMSFINAVLAAANDTVNNPSVLSISWGTQDSYFNGYFGLFEPAFQTAVARGLTVFVSTGDYGVKATPSSPTYSLDYPSSSPYVVASGGTVISINNDYSIASETAWGTAGGTTAGGGGVSSIFSVPSWQSGLTTMTYPGSTVATISGRATPDVSAMATGYAIYWYNFTTTGTAVTNVLNGFAGTSAVAPLLAGMMARLNQASGKRIGFVNADWYSNRAACFNDITTGDNHGPNTVGYRATGSWDAATGLGSPVGTSLYNLYNVGTTFPKLNYGFRPKSGSAYPRNLPNAR